MTQRRLRRASLPVSIAALILCVGCAASRQITAGVGDYDQYRRLRTAHTVEDRMAQAWRYLREYPEGRWSGQVRTWFGPAERRYFASVHDNADRLRMYLDAMPDGPHAKQAAQRIAELELAEQYRQQHEERFLASAHAVEQRLAHAQAMRHELVEQFSNWARRVAMIRSFGRRTDDLPAAFIFPWRLEKPEARCVESVCKKTLSISYAIPSHKKLEPRQAIFDVLLRLDDTGRVTRAVITGPDLFSRVGEAVQLGPVEPDSPRARAEAIGRSVQVVSSAVAKPMPSSQCSRAAVSPVVLSRQCGGIRLDMIAAVAPGQEDRIVVQPAPAPSGK